MATKTCYALRLPARILDLSMVGLIILAAEKINPHPDIGMLVFFYLYNVTTILCGGTTLGKYVFSLKVESSAKGFGRLLLLSVRETLMLALLPLLSLNFIFISDVPLHDKIIGSKVMKDER